MKTEKKTLSTKPIATKSKAVKKSGGAKKGAGAAKSSKKKIPKVQHVETVVHIKPYS